MEKNYRIRVEALDGAPSVIPEECERNECEGFCLLTYDGERWDYTVENVTTIELAKGILHSLELTEAGMIAQGILNAHEFHSRILDEKAKNMMKGFQG